MKRLIGLIGLLIALSPAQSFARARLYGWCEQGNGLVTMATFTSSIKVQRSFPACTLTVYVNGTVTLATLYADNSSTPLANPFTASGTGYWDFYADNGRYDVQLSGGGLSSPFTLFDNVLYDSSVSVAAALVNVGPYNFTPQTPGSTLSAGVQATVALSPCPRGVNGSDSSHYVYLSGGVGTAEAPIIAGGTCTSGASSGTVIFTPANNHSGAWTIASATAGYREAIIDSSAGSILQGVPASPTFYASLAVDKALSVMFGGGSVALRGSPGISCSASGAAISGTVPYGAQLFHGTPETMLITNSATADLINVSADCNVSDLGFQSSVSRSGGAGLHLADNGGGTFSRLFFQKTWNGIQLDGGSTGKFFSPTMNSTSAPGGNWNAMIYAAGCPACATNHQYAVGADFYSPNLSVDAVMASGGAVVLGSGVDTYHFFELSDVAAGGSICRPDALTGASSCGAGILFAYTDLTNVLDPARSMKFHGGVVESGPLDINIDAQAFKDAEFYGTDLGNGLINMSVDAVSPSFQNPGQFRWYGGRIVQAQQQNILIKSAARDTQIEGSRIVLSNACLQTPCAASGTYPAVEVQGGANSFEILSNNFDPDFAATRFPSYYVQIDSGGGGSDRYIVSNNSMNSSYRVTGDVIDNNTLGQSKVIGPQIGDTGKTGSMYLPGSVRAAYGAYPTNIPNTLTVDLAGGGSATDAGTLTFGDGGGGHCLSLGYVSAGVWHANGTILCDGGHFAVGNGLQITGSVQVNGANFGQTGTITVNQGGGTCTIIYTNGIKTGGTC